MVRGPLFQNSYSPRFSGHETFPLRYGWLKKVYERVSETQDQHENRNACWGDGAIARFGVGKNMVSSMRHWANAAGIIDEPSTNTVRTTELGRKVFSDKGLDPYMEHPNTLWLIHWKLAARPAKTTWFWSFSHYPGTTFDRDGLANKLDRLAKSCEWRRAAAATIKNDVTCFVRTYVARPGSARTGHDDVLESPLTELGLIKAVGRTNAFRFVRGPKPTMGDGVFAFALTDFWKAYRPNASTLAFEAIAHAPGSPGRVFVLDENDVVDRLAGLDDATEGAFRWSETAGLKQVVRSTAFADESGVLKGLARGYRSSDQRESG